MHQSNNLVDWEFDHIYDPRNVIDELKGLSRDEIVKSITQRRVPVWVAMCNWSHDINFSGAVRSANAFGMSGVIQISDSKRWDRRGSVGTHHYTNVYHTDDVVKVLEFARLNDLKIICIENNTECIRKPISLYKYDWDPNLKYLLVFGSESDGVHKTLLNYAYDTVFIEQYGSIRSLNAASAVSIVMYDYRQKMSTRGKHNVSY